MKWLKSKKKSIVTAIYDLPVNQHSQSCLSTELANSKVWELPNGLFWHFLQKCSTNLAVLIKSLVVFKILDLAKLLFYWVTLRRFCMISQHFFFTRYEYFPKLSRAGSSWNWTQLMRPSILWFRTSLSKNQNKK